ncbi:hypothetical protein CONLIGDRAFT_346502 [Coniochaeta ligniaria NRRL 30616]|uniref:Myb-like domain-containing protein n=1 Tax=Coniochaeta ligniaria NRRL 30616 TaxID=1408157 RepID=A0A1J7IQS4_9PEZI|nr:hypothetical protein CONLIGDRAFT_346502 [Coniochaeta ligniaria NRRL 30616]
MCHPKWTFNQFSPNSQLSISTNSLSRRGPPSVGSNQKESTATYFLLLCRPSSVFKMAENHENLHPAKVSKGRMRVPLPRNGIFYSKKEVKEIKGMLNQRETHGHRPENQYHEERGHQTLGHVHGHHSAHHRHDEHYGIEDRYHARPYPFQPHQPPSCHPPSYHPSRHQAPSYQAPSYQAPIYQAPTFQAPTYEAPTYEAPTYEAPTYEAPIYQAPTFQAPTYEAPTYEAPTYEAPVYQAPVYQAPVYQAPTYQAPVYQPPTFQPPISQRPAYQALTYSDPDHAAQSQITFNPAKVHSVLETPAHSLHDTDTVPERSYGEGHLRSPCKPQLARNANNITTGRDAQKPGVQSNEQRASGRPWTSSDDALLLSLNEDGLSPQDAAQVLGRPKQDVRDRYRQLIRDRNTIPLAPQVASTSGRPSSVGDVVPVGGDDTTRDADNRDNGGDDSFSETRSSSSSRISGGQSSGAQYVEQMSHKEYMVAMLPRNYILDYDALYKVEPDQHFSLLDCKLLALLEVKHARAIRWEDLQTDFLRATGRFLAVQLLREMLENPATRHDGYFTAQDYRTLLFLFAKQQDEKWLAIQTDFRTAAGRLIEVEVLKRKLGGDKC